nr:hypothetical protein [Streptomyces diacarni]
MRETPLPGCVVRHSDALEGQLDPEQPGGRTFEGVALRVAQRVLAMAGAIWRQPQGRRLGHAVAGRIRPLLTADLFG